MTVYQAVALAAMGWGASEVFSLPGNLLAGEYMYRVFRRRADKVLAGKEWWSK